MSDKAFGFLGTAFFLVYFLTSPLFGYLGDRLGRLRLMAGGAVLWSLATSLTFWVPSYPFLVGARGLVGVGEASFGTLAPAYLADILPMGRRARALGLFYLALPVGTALAYLVGGLMGSHRGWRPAFLLAGLPGLLMAGLIYRLSEVRSEPRLTDAPPARPVAPDASWHLFKVPTLRRVTLGYGMVTFALGGLAFWMPHYLEVAKGLSLSQANLLLFGSVTVAGGLGTLTGGFLGVPPAHLHPGRAPVGQWPGNRAGPAPGGPGHFCPPPRPSIFPALAGAIFLLFLNPGVLTAVVVSVAGPWRRAQAVALNIVVIHLVGDVPSPFLIGWVSDLGSLKWGVSLTLVALAAGAVFIFSALPHLKATWPRPGRLIFRISPTGPDKIRGWTSQAPVLKEPASTGWLSLVPCARAASPQSLHRAKLMNPKCR